MDRILNTKFWGNSVLEYFIFAGAIILSIGILKLFEYFLFYRIKQASIKSKTKIDDMIIQNLGKYALPFLYFIVIYFCLNLINVQPQVKKVIDVAIIIISTFFVIRLIVAVITHFLKFYWTKGETNGESEGSIRGLSTFISILIWGIGLVFLLDNLGFQISAVIAGLGIGGIAIGLAAQTVLGDLFSYFVIFFDKPFKVGDFITVDTKAGTVEKIGIKTTRVESITGEQIIFSNSDLTNARVHNFKKMEKRRIVFKFGVTYNTSTDKLRQIPDIVKEIINTVEGAQFDRAHFFAYGDFSLVFEIVYYVLSANYLEYMDFQHEINLKLNEEFNKQQIKFAYPTQTIYINNDAGK
ncbi:MAG: mechanosensitive ion channel family protein [Ignavibacteriales bacterium]|nr:MAG: mechanosensitive ion channel family protein [Ignavibacteriales bacterium]